MGARPQLAAGCIDSRSASVGAAPLAIGGEIQRNAHEKELGVLRRHRRFMKIDDNANSLRRMREQSLKNQRSLIGTKSLVRMPV